MATKRAQISSKYKMIYANLCWKIKKDLHKANKFRIRNARLWHLLPLKIKIQKINVIRLEWQKSLKSQFLCQSWLELF